MSLFFKKIKYLIILLIFTYLVTYSNTILSQSVFDTNFHHVDIQNNDISKYQSIEINKIKKNSLTNILNRILLNKEKNKFDRLINIDKELDFLVKNILIENEFISQNKYTADIKINFDKKEIINILHEKKINYTDITSPNHLLIIAEKNNFSFNGLTNNNIFYKKNYIHNNNLFKIILPDRSANDRFILPYEKIINKDLQSFNKISKKYNVKYSFIILIDNIKDSIVVNLYLFSINDNSLLFIGESELLKDSNNNYELISLLNAWWKKNNLIDTSEINELVCRINTPNIEILKIINLKINSISQVKSNIVNMIKYNSNLQKITFFGNPKVLFLSLLKNNIDIKINNNNKCFIKLIF